MTATETPTAAEVTAAFEALGIEPPNLFLVGAVKAGTTSLWHHLDAHPDVFMTTPKEPHFFRSRRPDWAVHDARTYARLFARAGAARYRGEASATYLHDPWAPGLIRAAFGRPTILVSLRDPVERAHADYLMSVRFGWNAATFEEAVRDELRDPPEPDRKANRFVQQGRYAEQLERWRSAFGEQSVHVVFFEELFADVEAGMRELFVRLGLDPAPAAALDPAPQFRYLIARNRALATLQRSRRVRRLSHRVLRGPARSLVERVLFDAEKPPIAPGTRTLLREHYAPHDERLRALLGRPLPWDGRP